MSDSHTEQAEPASAILKEIKCDTIDDYFFANEHSETKQLSSFSILLILSCFNDCYQLVQ